MLFITNGVLGWRTFGGLLQKETEIRDDIVAVHIGIGRSRVTSVLNKARLPAITGVPAHVHLMRSWRNRVSRWIEGPIDLSHFDVVHVSPQIPALAVAEAKLRRPLKMSVVLDATVRQAKSQRKGLDEDQVHERFGPMVDAERLVIKQADLVWTLSRWAADGVRREQGLREDEVRLLPPVISCPHRSWPDADPRSDTLANMAFVGNDFVRKGGPRLLRWHQEHFAERSVLHVFTSQKPPRSPLRNVEWNVRVPHDELINERLPRMDLFVMPTFSDMSPWAIAEAVAVGLPVVSSDIGGLSDLVVDGVTGYLAPVNDESAFIGAIDKLLTGRALRTEFGRATRRYADDNLDPVKVMRSFLDSLVALAD